MKSYLSKLYQFMMSKKVLYAFLFIVLLIAAPIHHFWTRDRYLLCFLLLFILTYGIQALLLLRKSYFLYICRIILCLLIVSQLGWIIYERKQERDSIYQTFSEGWRHELDIKTGYKHLPNLHELYATSFWGNDTIYHFTTSTDSLGRRVSGDTTGVNDPDTISKKHAVFLGCSLTFGQGLNYSSSFPFLFQEANPEYRSYNYGVGGWGTHQIALLFDTGINTLNRSAIKENEGFAVYTFINDHLNRVYGGAQYLHANRYGTITPDVYVENDSLIVKRRSKLQLWGTSLCYDVGLARILNVAFSYPKTEKYYRRFAGLVNYIAKKYWELYPENNFYVAVYPTVIPSDDLKWTKYLAKEIKLINVDFPGDYFQDINKYDIKHDNHPNKVFNEYFVEKISKVIIETERKE